MDARDIVLAASGRLYGSSAVRAERVPLTIEIAWEVCNKVGGIHTVIKTKVPQTIKTLGENNYM
jgi:hypothetical protein